MFKSGESTRWSVKGMLSAFLYAFADKIVLHTSSIMLGSIRILSHELFFPHCFLVRHVRWQHYFHCSKPVYVLCRCPTFYELLNMMEVCKCKVSLCGYDQLNLLHRHGILGYYLPCNDIISPPLKIPTSICGSDIPQLDRLLCESASSIVHTAGDTELSALCSADVNSITPGFESETFISCTTTASQ
jgi:hypothetical protein